MNGRGFGVEKKRVVEKKEKVFVKQIK